MKLILIVSTIILLAAASLIYVTTVNTSNNESSVVENAEIKKNKDESCCSTSLNPSSAELTANSIYQINSKWKNQFNNEVDIRSLQQNTQVIAMIFANCNYACPLLVNDMRQIENKLSSKELANIKFTLFSIDPERDTPERLIKFADDQKLNFSRWQLLTGNRNDIDDLAAMLGFRYKKESDGSFSHSNIITILNANGEIKHQVVGLQQDISSTVKIIQDIITKGV